ncbi:MAG TPA: hypothetical protein VFY41_01970 [Nitrososphaeraceae archaeon]|nr:hypothetical protein [Nitrososphaeraceae archaeon]
MNQRTIIAPIFLATILTASIVAMALPLKSAEASRGSGDAIGGDGGDAMAGDFEADGDGNVGNTAVGDDADSEAIGGDGGTAIGGDGGTAISGADDSDSTETP